MWRLPHQTHHSVHLDEDGTLWVCGQRRHEEPDPRFPNRRAPFDEYTLLQVSPEGAILSEWSVADLLIENGLRGLMHLGSVHNESTVIRGDALHLNDVEPFPASMEEGFFRRGDVLVSLRNINTVFAFNRETRRIGFVCTGWFVRQHDPDFLDGNRFSVFDNQNLGPEKLGHQSRIVVVDAAAGTRQVVFEGSAESPFYTHIMGKHQWLPGGNLLITESMKGRAFEITPEGERVWSYFNEVGTGLVGIVEEVQRVPLSIRQWYAATHAGPRARARETTAPMNGMPGKAARRKSES